jgi:hypothetical protein
MVLGLCNGAWRHGEVVDRWNLNLQHAGVFRKVACLTVCSVITFLETDRTQLQKYTHWENEFIKSVQTYVLVSGIAEYMRKKNKQHWTN